jgi:poly(hydroxyalkanoate) granule-associated protein
MATKKSKYSGFADNDTAKAVTDSAQKIWLAGLGAFERAKAEGPKMFEVLVEQGKGFAERARGAADQALASVRESASGAGGRFDKLEQVFEDRVARALSKLGVHTQSDVEKLSERVDALADAVNELMKATGVTPKRRARPSPMKKMVKGAVKSARRSASSVASTASGAVGAATKTAKRTVRTARKVVKGALG